MKIGPIKIRVGSKWKYGLIAFLVDREDYLKDVSYFRDRLGIKSLISRKLLSERLFQNVTKLKNNKIQRNIVPHDVYALIVLNKYHKSEYYKRVIIQSFYTGIIQEEDLVDNFRLNGPAIFEASDLPAYGVGPTFKDDPFHQTVVLKETEMAIIITPEATLKDVEKVYKRLDSIKKLHTDIWIPQDTISNIRRDRKWYWMSKKGMTLSQIIDVTKIIDRISKQGVYEAIKQYKQRLFIKYS